MENTIYATVSHLDDFGCTYCFRPGQTLVLKKDPDNPYDDEAILVYDRKGNKCGYVANSVSSVARGTYSAGRLCEKILEEQQAVIRFILDDVLIIQLID